MSFKLNCTISILVSCFVVQSYGQDFEKYWQSELAKLNLTKDDTVITFKYPPLMYPISDSLTGLGEIRYHNLAYIILRRNNKLSVTKIIDYFHIVYNHNKIKKSTIRLQRDDTTFSLLSANYKTIMSVWDEILPYISRVERDGRIAYLPVHASHPTVITIGILMKNCSFEYEVDSDSILSGYGSNTNLNYEYNILTKRYLVYNSVKKLIESVKSDFRF